MATHLLPSGCYLGDKGAFFQVRVEVGCKVLDKRGGRRKCYWDGCARATLRCCSRVHTELREANRPPSPVTQRKRARRRKKGWRWFDKGPATTLQTGPRSTPNSDSAAVVFFGGRKCVRTTLHPFHPFHPIAHVDILFLCLAFAVAACDVPTGNTCFTVGAHQVGGC